MKRSSRPQHAQTGNAENRIFILAVTLVALAGLGALLVPKQGRKPVPPATSIPAPLALPRPLADFQLTNTVGQVVSRADLADRIVVVNFVFTSCSLSCLAVNERMAELQHRLANTPDVKLISLSVDPRSDSPAVLGEFGRRFGAEADRWDLLTGDKTQLYRLLETSFLAKSPDLDQFIPGGFLNTDRIMLVDPRGNVCASFNGLAANAADRVMDEIAKLRATKGNP